MTTHAETVLYASLTDVDALEELAKIGIELECIPTEGMREVVAWSIEYFHRSGRAKAPSREMFGEQWGKRLEQCQIELPEEDLQLDEVSWAVEALKSQYVLAETQRLQREIAVALAQAETSERIAKAAWAAEEFHQLAMRVRDRTNEVEAVDGLQASLIRYEQRAAHHTVAHGLTLGIEGIDQHTLGIHPGEIAVWAAGAKAGKSWVSSWAAISEWRRQRETVLYTLENSVEMTYDRIACQICAVDYREYQKGNAKPEEIERIREFLRLHGDDLRNGLFVISPELGRRTPASLIRHAQSLSAKSVIIDQLSHIEHPQPVARRPRHETVRDIMMGLGNLISAGRNPIPLLLNVQINREGMAAAQKAGRLELQHLAESAEIERSASWVFGLMRSEIETTAGMATVQTLASRRMDLKHWSCVWKPWYGMLKTLREVDLTC